jgi:hypothetical protein
MNREKELRYVFSFIIPSVSYILDLHRRGCFWIIHQLAISLVNFYIAACCGFKISGLRRYSIDFWRIIGQIFKVFGCEVEDWDEYGEYYYFKHPFLKYVYRGQDSGKNIWEAETLRFPS